MIEYFRGTRKRPYHISAGALVYSPAKKTWEVLLLFRKRMRDRGWYLPKGTAKPGETLLQTASREVLEETGYQVKTKDYLGALPSQYRLRDRTMILKTTHYFSGTVIGQPQTRQDHKHDFARWVKISDAYKRLAQNKYCENEETIIKRFRKSIKYL